MKLTITEVSPEQFKELITEGREPLATDAAPSTAERRVAEWIEAALRRYPMNWAFDATNPALVIDNIISGATAEAWNKSGEVESLFSVTMKEIHDEAEGALRYPQVCDAQTAVRRLAVRSKELESENARLRAAFMDAGFKDAIGRNVDLIREADKLRRVVNRVAAQVGHPPIAPGELGIESVAEAVERHAAYAREREETLDSITPEKLQAFAASEGHHEEHHEREKELEAQLLAAEEENARLRAIISNQK
jgi:hypothetical protein